MNERMRVQKMQTIGKNPASGVIQSVDGGPGLLMFNQAQMRKGVDDHDILVAKHIPSDLARQSAEDRLPILQAAVEDAQHVQALKAEAVVLCQDPAFEPNEANTFDMLHALTGGSIDWVAQGLVVLVSDEGPAAPPVPPPLSVPGRAASGAPAAFQANPKWAHDRGPVDSGALDPAEFSPPEP